MVKTAFGQVTHHHTTCADKSPSPPRRYNKTKGTIPQPENERCAAPAKKQCFPRTKTPFYNL